MSITKAIEAEEARLKREGGVLTIELAEVEGLLTRIDARDGDAVRELRPVQARLFRGLVAEVRRLTAAVEDVSQDRDSWRKLAGERRDALVNADVAEQDAYRRGRREAIEEAVKVLGEWTRDQVVINGFARQMRTGHGFSDAAAELNAKGPARGQ